MRDELNKYYQRVRQDIDKYNSLLFKFAYDAENNIIYLENNLILYRDHIQKNVFGNTHYRIEADTILITHILNYVCQVKAYLNRKKRAIEKNFKYAYKDEILKIFEKYWKANRRVTKLDVLIMIRDQFEHERLSGFAIQYSFDGKIKREQIMIEDRDISVLFYDAYIEIKKMNSEITDYINQEMRKIDLKHCLHFMYAFHRKYKVEPYHNQVMIPESQEDIILYDKLIKDLSASDE